MILLAGLGNPGTKYAGNRHNVGFMAVDEIVSGHGFSPWRRRFQGEASEGRLADEKVLVLKPQTYMNESGRAVGEAMRFFNLGVDDVVVFYDELDLPPGKLRCKTGGGLAGHNGLKSIKAHIGADFHRIRIGIGHPGDKAKVHSHVLKDFSKAEQYWLVPLLSAIDRHADLVVTRQFSTFQNKVHLALEPAEPKKPEKPAAGPQSNRRTQAPQGNVANPFSRLKDLIARADKNKD